MNGSATKYTYKLRRKDYNYKILNARCVITGLFYVIGLEWLTVEITTSNNNII